MIKIDFEFTTQHGIFRDAIYLPEDHTFTQEEIDVMKQQRLDNWIAIIEAPPPPEPPAPPAPPQTININGLEYQILEGVPPSGSRLVEVDGVWYYRVE